MITVLSFVFASLLVVSGCSVNVNGKMDSDSEVPNPCGSVQVWYTDTDGDGSGGYDATAVCGDTPPGSGYAKNNGDCDDTNSAIHPNAEEVCDNLDNNCNQESDEGAVDAQTWYTDSDGDGFGGTISISTCEQPLGTVALTGDCDDANAEVNLGSTEVCNGQDDDCNGLADDYPSDGRTYYTDADNDGFGIEEWWTKKIACEKPAFYSSQIGDCDDANAEVNPAKLEVCDDLDNNCDGLKDNSPLKLGEGTSYWPDLDSDGFGDFHTTSRSCSATPPAGYADNDTDCDDWRPDVNPDAEEVCDFADNDCNSLADDNDPNVSGGSSFYADSDGDLYGDPNTVFLVCDPTLYSAIHGFIVVADASDCNDADRTISPRATDICGDGIDQDCSGDDCTN